MNPYLDGRVGAFNLYATPGVDLNITQHWFDKETKEPISLDTVSIFVGGNVKPDPTDFTGTTEYVGSVMGNTVIIDVSIPIDLEREENLRLVVNNKLKGMGILKISWNPSVDPNVTERVLFGDRIMTFYTSGPPGAEGPPGGGSGQWDEVIGGLSTDGTAAVGVLDEFPVILGGQGENIKWQHPDSDIAGRINQRSNTEIVWSANVNDNDELDDPDLPAAKMAIYPAGNEFTIQSSPPGEDWDGETQAKMNLETGEWSFSSLEGEGLRMVVVDEFGKLTSEPLSSGAGDMSSLIYDPGGRASDAFDLSNQTGVLDGGTFN